ncbi:MAG: hypothetical protein QOI20_2183, partial [Acidimicrobiaceae bacterium]|nr:hypothetical protein [Acidimicrobiaceae bacterium]
LAALASLGQSQSQSQRRRRSRSLAALGLLGCLTLAGCGGGAKGHALKVKEIPAAAMPAELLGMKLEPEKSAELIKGDKRPFIEQIGLFSMRKDDLLQATLQAARFTKEARTDQQRFRDSLAGQVSSSTPQVLRMGGQLVYMSAGQKQSLVVWFKDRTMFVLAIRDEFPQPRALLRSALEIKA